MMRLWVDRVEVGAPSACWRWLGAVSGNGHAYVYYEGRIVPVHRLVAGLFGSVTGPVHHSCENPRCVNPNHLVPTADNAEHKTYHRSPTCWKGHAMIEYGKRGRRRCRECHAEEERVRRALKIAFADHDKEAQ